MKAIKELTFPVNVEFEDNFYDEFNGLVDIRVEVLDEEYESLIKQFKTGETFVFCKNLEEMLIKVIRDAFDLCEEDFYDGEDIVTDFTIGYPKEIAEGNNIEGMRKAIFVIYREVKNFILYQDYDIELL